jgi:hypothetical protein
MGFNSAFKGLKHILYLFNNFKKIKILVEKCTARQAKDNDMSHTLCMPDK